jgi:class 3 adenylate cyclase
VGQSSEPPVGTIAMLFTDVEGSTRLATQLGPRWAEVLAEHHRIVGGAIAAEGGWVDGTEGDAYFATWSDPAAAARAAVASLRALRAHAWPADVGELKVRMGLHVGHVERTGTGYVGLEVHRAARVGAAAHGGQLLLSAAARELIRDAVATEPVGSHRLKDFPMPEVLFCAVVDGLGAASFPPPRAHAARPTNLPAGLPRLGPETTRASCWNAGAACRPPNESSARAHLPARPPQRPRLAERSTAEHVAERPLGRHCHGAPHAPYEVKAIARHRADGADIRARRRQKRGVRTHPASE